MAWIKLDKSIMASSVWRPRELRTTWVTMLLMAEPITNDKPSQAYHPVSGEPTWVVPPGRYGIVHASSDGIAGSDGLSVEECDGYLVMLSEPEKRSRTQAHGGRRIARIDGGFLILNYAKYRDAQETSIERVRRWRERQKSERETLGNGNGNGSNGVDRDVDVDVDGEQKDNNNSRTRAKPPRAAAVVARVPSAPNDQDNDATQPWGGWQDLSDLIEQVTTTVWGPAKQNRYADGRARALWNVLEEHDITSPEFICRCITEQARARRRAHDPRPNSPMYYEKGLIDGWEREAATRAVQDRIARQQFDPTRAAAEAIMAEQRATELREAETEARRAELARYYTEDPALCERLRKRIDKETPAMIMGPSREEFINFTLLGELRQQEKEVH